MKRKLVSATSLKLNPNIKCRKSYPRIGSKRTLDKLVSFALILDKTQAFNLAMDLLASSQEWPNTTVTVFRKTGQVTVTTGRERERDEVAERLFVVQQAVRRLKPIKKQ